MRGAPNGPRAGALTVADRTVLLTGAAGGLGSGTTLQFLRAGTRVVALDIDAAKLDRLSQDAKAEHLSGFTSCPTDLADLEALRDRLERVSRDLGGFDVVINNAAIYPSKLFEDYTIEEHQAVQRVNVDAAIVCVQVALPHMKRENWGRIVNISSVTAYGGWERLSPYVQSKGALVGLTRAWAREFGPYGITVNAVSPGAFPTDAEKIHLDAAGYERFVLEHQAIKRRGCTNDVANALLYLASEESAFVTGQTLNVDGGWVMH